MTPEIVIISTLANSHLGRLGSVEAVAKECADLTKYMKNDGIIVVNHQDLELIKYYLPLEKSSNIVTVSLVDNTSDFWANNVTINDKGVSFYACSKSGVRSFVSLVNIYSIHNVLNALYVFAASIYLGIPGNIIAKRLGKYRTRGYRNNIYPSIFHRDLIYADCYNAIGKSVAAAIQAIDIIPVDPSCKKVAVIGDIAELGDYCYDEHFSILEIINESMINVVVFVGSLFKGVSYGFEFRNNLSVSYVPDSYSAYKELYKYRSKDNLFLFKGSHSIHLEECIKLLWPVTYYLSIFKDKFPKIIWMCKILNR